MDRIGTEHETIYLHNMFPDTELDKKLTLIERLTKRINSFNKVIGLETQLLGPEDSPNPRSIYAIYEGQLPEIEDDELDDVAAYQQGAGLLQKIQETDPELFARIQRLPDGIRSARVARREGEQIRMRLQLDKEIIQPALLSIAELEAPDSPLAAPRPGESVTFLKSGDVVLPYAVDDMMAPRRITQAQLLSAVKCAEDEPRRYLPRRTNERVMAAFASAQADLAQRGIHAVPKSNPRSRSYIRKQLKLWAEHHKHDDEELLRTDLLVKVFVSGSFPTHIGEELDRIRKLGLEGQSIVVRLDALRERYRLTPNSGGHGPRRREVLRIVCSESLE